MNEQQLKDIYIKTAMEIDWRITSLFSELEYNLLKHKIIEPKTNSIESNRFLTKEFVPNITAKKRKKIYKKTRSLKPNCKIPDIIEPEKIIPGHLHNYEEANHELLRCIGCNSFKYYKAKEPIIKSTYYKPEYEINDYQVNGMKLLTWITEGLGKHSKPKLAADFNKVKTCKHNRIFDWDLGDEICLKCHCVLNRIMVDETDQGRIKNQGYKFLTRIHDRGRWNNYTLDYIRGDHNKEITDQTWLELGRKIPAEFTWYDVYRVFHNYSFGDEWMGFGSYFGLNAKLSPKIIESANKYTNYKIGKYRINYQFLLYKFTQLFGEDEDDCQFIPLKGKKTWVAKMDEFWMRFCQEENLNFKFTKIYKLKWDKENQLRILARILRQMGCSTNQLRRFIKIEKTNPIQDGDEFELIWRKNEMIFINERNNQIATHNIKGYKIYRNEETYYFEGKSNKQIDPETYVALISKGKS